MGQQGSWPYRVFTKKIDKRWAECPLGIASGAVWDIAVHISQGEGEEQGGLGRACSSQDDRPGDVEHLGDPVLAGW